MAQAYDDYKKFKDLYSPLAEKRKTKKVSKYKDTSNVTVRKPVKKSKSDNKWVDLYE